MAALAIDPVGEWRHVPVARLVDIVRDRIVASDALNWNLALKPLVVPLVTRTEIPFLCGAVPPHRQQCQITVGIIDKRISVIARTDDVGDGSNRAVRAIAGSVGSKFLLKQLTTAFDRAILKSKFPIDHWREIIACQRAMFGSRNRP